MKRTSYSFLSLFLALLLTLTLLPFGVSAAWEGEVAENFASGNGTETDPYIIDSAGQLALLAKNVNEGTDNYFNIFFKLGNDIDLSGETQWVPIGSYASADVWQSFNGTFDGAGHTISGMNVTTTELQSVGLFGYVRNATIKNIRISNSIISGNERAGAVVGYAVRASRIINCVSDNNNISGAYVGGIVGDIDTALTDETTSVTTYNLIQSCFVLKGTIVCKSPSTGPLIGGIAGRCLASDITYCGNSADISISADDGTAGSRYIGGIVGVLGTTAGRTIVSNSFNVGKITANRPTGDKRSTWVGGICGRANMASSSISNSISAGSLECTSTPASTLGSVVGRAQAIQAPTNCYTDKDIGTNGAGNGTLSGVTLLTTEQMQGSAAFTNMTLGDCWAVRTDGYPVINAEKVMETAKAVYDITLTGNDVTVTGYTGTATSEVIPEAFGINGVECAVTAIAEKAFYDTALTEVTVKGNPAIGSKAFGYDGSDAPVSGFTIKGYTTRSDYASNIYEYAKANAITFKGLDLTLRGYQKSNELNATAPYKLRFAATCDSLNYQKVGFDITASPQGKEWHWDNITTVYSSITETLPDSTVNTITASEISGGRDRYIIAVAITGIPYNTDAATVITVTPYIINQAGEKVCSPSFSCTLGELAAMGGA